MEIYVVRSGDTIYSIGAQFGVPIEGIIYDNQLGYPYLLTIGQALLIREGNEEGGSRPVITNGYAYPFIRPWVLRETLPYLSELSVFSYGFTKEGDLVPPQVDDTWMIQLALDYRTRPILTLTPLDEAGKFNNYLIHVMVQDNTIRTNLIAQLLQIMSEKNYSGVDVDFEYILAEDRDAFVEFVSVLREEMNNAGYSVSVALAPKVSADQQGIGAGKDYKGIGAAANWVLLMTYEWGYTYGPPMAVAPLPNVRRVVTYAVTEIPADQINLGIPNYGYDWPLPYERGVTVARTIGNVEAVEIAVANKAEILYDGRVQSPYFYYTLDGTEHVVWFEDVRSLQAKFSLVPEYNLRGMGYWQIMRPFRANWLLLAQKFYIVK
ncbi:MAG: LysM peptidoglycan-binding domain-containing protein [Lachnospiraceae bacterium]|nr:LysM peptidoglycan-binding domain-containing protein [Lachnospiraceae bacterium]